MNQKHIHTLAIGALAGALYAALLHRLNLVYEQPDPAGRTGTWMIVAGGQLLIIALIFRLAGKRAAAATFAASAAVGGPIILWQIGPATRLRRQQQKEHSQ